MLPLNYKVDPVCHFKRSISHLSITGTIYSLFPHKPSKRVMFTLSACPSLDNPNFTCSIATYGEWLPHGSVWTTLSLDGAGCSRPPRQDGLQQAHKS